MPQYMRIIFGCSASLAILLFTASSWLLWAPNANAPAGPVHRGQRIPGPVEHAHPHGQPREPGASASSIIAAVIGTTTTTTAGDPADRDAGKMDANGTQTLPLPRPFNVTGWARRRARHLLRHWVDGVDPWFELGAGNRTHEGTCVLVIVDGKIHGDCETACPNNRCT